jgi:hypothetical protein
VTTTVDLRRNLPHLYRADANPALVDVPPLDYLMIDGHGDPNSAPEYAEAVQALYTVAFTIRFALKRLPEPVDAPVMPLEGLWWVSDMAAFTVEDKAAWDWTMMIAQSSHSTPEVAAAARQAAARKKAIPAISSVRLERYAEGRAAQILHRGPYSEEGPTVEALHRFIEDRGLTLSGKHHEIYLGDPRRTAPEKLRTIIRQPVASS